MVLEGAGKAGSGTLQLAQLASRHGGLSRQGRELVTTMGPGGEGAQAEQAEVGVRGMR